MKNSIFIKITMVILLISILLSSFSSVTVIADSSTTLEESKTESLNITVNNNGVDVAAYNQFVIVSVCVKGQVKPFNGKSV